MPLTDPPFDTRESEDDFGQSKNKPATEQKGPTKEMREKFEQLQNALLFRGLKPKTEGENDYKGLETFDKPIACCSVTLYSDEVTAVCLVTNQPDWYSVCITYKPREKCIESKSLKLFLHSFRNKGLFCEKFADEILVEIVRAVEPQTCSVTVMQKPRGGVSIDSQSYYERPESLTPEQS